MGLFDNIYFNYTSYISAIGAIFTLVIGFFLISIKNKSKASQYLGLSFLFISLPNLAFFAAACFYHPAAAYHRLVAGCAVLPCGIFIAQFFLAFPEENHQKFARLLKIAQWIVAGGIIIYYILVSIGEEKIFRISGQYWDLNLGEPARVLSMFILVFIFIILIIGVWKAIVTKDKKRNHVVLMLACILITIVFPGIANMLLEQGMIERSFFRTSYELVTIVGWFLTTIFYLSLTSDKTSFMAKIVGICLVTFLIILMFISSFTLSNRESIYDELHRKHVFSVVMNNQYRPPGIQYVMAYSVKTNDFDQVYKKETAEIDLSKYENEFLNLALFNKIKSAGEENFLVNVNKLLEESHPAFRGYKYSIVRFLAKNNTKNNTEAVQQAVLDHINGLRPVVSCYTSKISKIPVDDFKNRMEKFLRDEENKSDYRFQPFARAISEYLDVTALKEKRLREEVFQYILLLKNCGARVIRIGSDKMRPGLNIIHYVSYTCYDSTADMVYEAGFPYTDFREYVHVDGIKMFFILGIILVIVLFGFRLFFLQTLVRPIESLHNGLREVGEGNLDLVLPVKQEDEIGFLTHNFNHMVKLVKSSAKEIDDYTNNLEKIVEERTEQMQITMKELELWNESLIEYNAELKSAQRTAERDMRMAVNVQRKFLPQAVPESDEWDIVYSFKPMAGVSGDFYDFYVREKMFVGVGMFDVSGHGIASGLLTTIAKSIIFRKFMEGLDKDLNEVLTDINIELQNEIGEVGNYLTGVLIRFKQGVIEYVNAGHPEAYGRSGGKVFPLKRETGETVAGLILGLPGVNVPYDYLSREIKTGDYLVLFTDSILETMDTKQEEYGTARFMESIEKSPPGTAQEVLDFILEEFYSFVEDRDHLPDDLTVMILRKL
ncbi:MAG: SpoIIE family protein phosphatase [bacterium]|nr:SpoIIE family protein phosphatase [bacterium]